MKRPRPTKAKIRKRPLYEFGDLLPAVRGATSTDPSLPGADFYESDFGMVRLRGELITKALGAHRRLKRRKGRGRECYRNCGPCAAEPALNTFLKVVWIAGGLVSEIRSHES